MIGSRERKTDQGSRAGLGSKMRPKKKDRSQRTKKETLGETDNSDREQFLQAFEKPTQIYRYLRTRHIVWPIFLPRTLSFMKRRRSIHTCNKKRKAFKVDSILSAVQAKQNDSQESQKSRPQCMNLKFGGVFTDHQDINVDTVEVDVSLIKVCHAKRKDVVVPMSKAALGKFQVPINPLPDTTKTGETLVVPHGHFCHVNGTTVKSFSLVLSVRYPLNGSPMPNGYCNGDVDSETEEPPHKRRRNGQITPLEEKDFIHYSTELVIFDKYGQCQLTDGDYKLILYEQGNKSNASWESVMEGKPVGSFEIFNYYPTLHMTLCWKDEVKQESDYTSGISTAHNEFLNNNQYSSHFMSAFSSGNNNKENNQLTPKKRQRIFYQFLYNNNAKQQTEARDDMHCPWCFINCVEPYSLFKHLRLSHGRFNFIYVPHPKGYRVDVSINERYDGSYAGNPQDLHSHIGYAFSRRGPVRRTPITHILVYRPKRPESSLSEFMEQENDMQTNKQFVQGHNRLYYHSLTCEPMKPQDVDVDSEDENDPAWLRKKSVQMIDEFTDVNEGEKELMKLWNLLIMKYNYIADCQIPEACQKFVEEHGQELICKNLYRNFIVHLINLFDFSLIRPELVHRTVSMLDDLKEEIGVS